MEQKERQLPIYLVKDKRVTSEESIGLPCKLSYSIGSPGEREVPE